MSSRKASAATSAAAEPMSACVPRRCRRRAERLRHAERSTAEVAAMAEYPWPPAEKRKLIGKRISRVDGPQKLTGRARYTYDVRRPGLLYGKIVRCPHAHARVKSID